MRATRWFFLARAVRNVFSSSLERDFSRALVISSDVRGGLVVALIMSINYDRTELSTNIASGLVGFIGGAAIKRKGSDDKWH